MKDEKRIIDLEYNLICDFIKLRNELGLSQQKMADEIGIVREMITVIENRKKHPQINTLIRILEPFGYTLAITKILFGTKNKKNTLSALLILLVLFQKVKMVENIGIN